MSDASDYYWTNNLLQGFGDMWFLRAPQQTGIIGGGDKLLGSVLPRNQDSGFLSFNHYPAPCDFTTSQIILNKLQALQGNNPAGIVGPLTLSQNFATGTSVNSQSSGLQISANSGQIPSVPVILGISIDYSSVATFSVSLGDGTVANYIPLDYLAKLYAACGGDPARISAGPISIADQYICDSVLLASNYTVNVQMKTSLSASFQLGIKNLPTTGSITGSITSDNSFTLAITGKQYMIALGTRRWDDLA
jgi:hypothetical protein